jgi:hypothetical protein
VQFGDDPLLAFYDWDAPVSVTRSRTYGDAKLDWLSEYRGGWQFLVPNAGAACVVDEVPLPFHGEWSRTDVDIVHRSASEVAMRAGTRLPFVVHRLVQVLDDPARLAVTTTIENVTARAVPFIWSEDPAFLVTPGDRIDLPPGAIVDFADTTRRSTMWPDSSTGQSRLAEIPVTSPLQGVHYLPDRPTGWAALRRAHVGFGLAWDLTDFPQMWLWHEIGGTGFPFFGRASLIALEPASSWPGDGLAAAIESGQAHWLAPGASRTTSMTIVPFRPDGRAVVGVDQQGPFHFGSSEP